MTSLSHAGPNRPTPLPPGPAPSVIPAAAAACHARAVVDAPSVLGTRLAFRRVVVGCRVVGAGWLCCIGVVLLAGDGSPTTRSDRVVVATMAGAVAWAATTAVLAARRPSALVAPGFVLADVAVSALAVLSRSVVDVEIDSFYGGYPFSSVLVALHAGGIGAGLAAGAVLSVVVLGAGGSAAGQVGNVLIYVLGAVTLGWGAGVLRRAEAQRVAVEAALVEERAERRRADERAETAAHLHDSVLQTLALLQRRSADPTEVVALARRQERELRDWLAGPADARTAGGFAEAVRGAAAEVERDHRVRVEVVVVGDRPQDETGTALVAAAREALVNAARHAGVASVSLYAEAGPDAAAVFVRDRGRGFDPAAVPADRRGLAESVRGRIERAGGTARIRSAPGAGTEVELVVPAA